MPKICKSLSLAFASRPRDVCSRRCAALKKRLFNLRFLFNCLPRIKQWLKILLAKSHFNKLKKLPNTARVFYASLGFDCESAGHVFANSHFFCVCKEHWTGDDCMKKR